MAIQIMKNYMQAVDNIDQLITSTQEKLKTLHQLREAILEEHSDIVVDNVHGEYIVYSLDKKDVLYNGTKQQVERWFNRPINSERYKDKKVHWRTNYQAG